MTSGKVVTLDSVESTQDAAVELDLQVGDVCRSFNQTSGRGRRGNSWESKGGVAITVVLQSATNHLPIAIAATLALRLNNLIPHETVGIKWPNDLFIDGKKLAGVLIEQRGGKCIVGIGVNVRDIPFPNSISMQLVGFKGSLEEVADIVAGSVTDAAQLNENTAVTAWARRDILVGTYQVVQSGDNLVEGLVLCIDPCHRLIMQTTHGILELPAATSSIVTPCNETR